MVTRAPGTPPAIGDAVRVRDVETKSGRASLRRAVAHLRPDPESVSVVIAVVRAAVRAHRERFAHEILDRAASQLRADGSGPGDAALMRLADQRFVLALDRGETPAGWQRQVADVLATADRSTAEWSGDLVADASDIAFHRTLQLDAPMTPLAEDPDAFLHPFRTNETIARARANFTSAGPYPHRFPGYDVCVVSEGNLNFVRGIDERLEALGSSTGHVNIAALREDFPGSSHDAIAAVVRGEGARWHAPLGVLFGNTELVWAEWAQRQALIPSHGLPAGPRFIVRLHAFEVFTALPQFVNWNRVDALVVVSPVMANAVNAILPVPPTVPVHIIGNHLEPAPFDRPKHPKARFTIAMVGHNSQVKDPDWALDVLDIVRRTEPGARMLFIGEVMTPTHRAQGPGANAYAHRFLDRLTRYVSDGAASVTGHVDDVAVALQGAGFIVSTSRRESFHQGLVEGALSGCVAACRDWPIMAPFGGPATFLPDRWVVPDAAAMARRILDFMADEDAWRGEGRRCRDEARDIARSASDDRLTQLLRPRGGAAAPDVS